MKIQFLSTVSVALLQSNHVLSHGVRSGYLTKSFSEYVQDKVEHSGNGYSCGMECQTDSDCYQGGFVDCGECNQIHGTEGYHTCISSSTPAPTPWDYFPEGGQCSHHCHSDSDCQKGGFNPCGSCGQYKGTVMYHRCYAPEPTSEEVVEDFLEHSGNGYSCGMECQTDSDCYQGGFVDCGECNQIHGTEGYHTCISSSTPAPTPWNYFPEGGQCSHHCHSDSDCQKGGFNPCGSCGQYKGTIMYHRCYAPEPTEIEE